MASNHVYFVTVSMRLCSPAGHLYKIWCRIELHLSLPERDYIDNLVK